MAAGTLAISGVREADVWLSCDNWQAGPDNARVSGRLNILTGAMPREANAGR